MVNRIIWTSVACAFFVGIVGGYAIFESTDYDEVITPVISNMEHTTRSPWASEQTREIKSLSARDLEGLPKGQGVGMALLAELNSYPEPRHVLDLSSELGLTSEQQKQIEQIYEEMKEQAIPLGLQFIEIEREMDQKFIDKTIAPDELSKLIQQSGEVHWKLRNTHLQSHLKTVEILSPEQILRYNELRGYS